MTRSQLPTSNSQADLFGRFGRRPLCCSLWKNRSGPSNTNPTIGGSVWVDRRASRRSRRTAASARNQRALEQIPERELHVAAVAVLGSAAAEVGVGDVGVRSAQVRVVGEVEDLHPELHL